MNSLKVLLFFLISVILIVTVVNSATTSYAKTDPDKVSKNEILVKFKQGVSSDTKKKVHEEFKTTVKERIPKIDVEVVSIPGGKVDEFVSKFKNSPHVQYAEPNAEAQALAVTNDPSLSSLWGLFKIDAADSSTSAWDITTGAGNVKVAILDTGIEEAHQDLVEKVALSQNFTDSPTVSDLYGHGTHVAGTVGAATNNGVGVAGVGYNTSLMNGKVLGDNGGGYYSWIVSGVIWAADNGANVINMSLGGTFNSLTLEDAVNYAWSKGVVVVAAAGNSGNSTPLYPAYYTNSIAVAATDSNDNKASFSSYGSWVDVAAPGDSVYSTYRGNSYATLSGTSMASPHVAGTAALVWAKGDCATNSCVRNKVETTSDQISGTGIYWTWGRINAYKAVGGTVSATPTPTPTPTATPTATLTPTPQPQLSMTVSLIEMWYTSLGSYRYVYTKVTVRDEATNAAVSSANVSLTTTTPTGKINSFSGNTNSSGQVQFRIRSKEKGTYISNVTNVSKSGYAYHPTNITQSLVVN